MQLWLASTPPTFTHAVQLASGHGYAPNTPPMQLDDAQDTHAAEELLPAGECGALEGHDTHVDALLTL